MPKAQTRPNPYRNTEHSPKTYKTRELVIPFPDTKMRITVMVFSMYSCPNVEKFRRVASKIKLGSEDIEL